MSLQETINKLTNLVRSSDLPDDEKKLLLVRLKAFQKAESDPDGVLEKTLVALLGSAQSDIAELKNFFASVDDHIMAYIKEGDDGLKAKFEKDLAELETTAS